MIQGVPLEKSEIIDAIYCKKGVIRHAAILLSCDPSSIYLWMERDHEVAEAVKDARDRAAKARLDLEEEIKTEAYDSILDLLNKRDPTATIFTLKSKCQWTQGENSSQTINIQRVEKPYRQEPTLPKEFH